VIIGAGFGGLNAAKVLSNKPVEVLLIDRANYHTFTPLLYQVATCGLEPEEIGYPVRGIFRGAGNLQFLMGEVTAIDKASQVVSVRTNGTVRAEPYDYLIVAAGSVTNDFKTPGVEQHGFELKDLEDAVMLRNHILSMFERAVWVEDPAKKQALTTIVVVGGGPTGLETAGALHELYTHVLQKEYPQLEALASPIVLIEATDRLLGSFPSELQQSAQRQLDSLGVKTILGQPLVEAASDHIVLQGGDVIPTYTLIWSAGVKASPLAQMLEVVLSRANRVPVLPTLQMAENDHVYVVGDMAYLEDSSGAPYPMLIPVATQQGILAAHNILNRIAGAEEATFKYSDRGIMATIGRDRAVAWIYNRVKLSGYIAWLSWLGLHLIALMGFRNRLNVFINWVWNYLTYDRSVRLILRYDDGARKTSGMSLNGRVPTAEAQASQQSDLL
jgi:NADH dehydrogenase